MSTTATPEETYPRAHTTNRGTPQFGIVELHSSIGELAAALAAAQGEMVGAEKGRENPFFKSRYATLADVWGACRAPLAKHGLAVIQLVQKVEAGLVLETILAHKSGQQVVSVYPIQPVKNDPQGIGSAITYARRYSLSAMVGVAPEDDDDGNAASGREAGKGSGVRSLNDLVPPAAARQSPPENAKEAKPAAPAPSHFTAFADATIARIAKIDNLHEYAAWKKKHAKELDAFKAQAPTEHARVAQAALKRKTDLQVAAEGPEPPMGALASDREPGE